MFENSDDSCHDNHITFIITQHAATIANGKSSVIVSICIVCNSNDINIATHTTLRIYTSFEMKSNSAAQV